MVSCRICGIEGKVLTKHLRSAHGLSKSDYMDLYPDALIVDPETTKRGREISSYMHTDEIKRVAAESRRAYWRTISSEELSERIAPMIAQKRTEEERKAQGERVKVLARELNESSRYEEYRKARDQRFSKMVKDHWENDPDYRYSVTERFRELGLHPDESTREVRRNNMRTLNKNMYSDDDYRKSVASPLWGKGASGGSRGGIRVSYISRDNREFRFRSLWELCIALYLDDLQEYWDYESVNILYGNRKYIPDFYLKERNLILEVKPKEYIDELAEIKRKATISAGYRFSYITDDIADTIDLTTLDYRDEVVQYKENVQRLSKANELRELIESVE